MHSFVVGEFLEKHEYKISEREFYDILNSEEDNQIYHLETHFEGNFMSRYTLYTEDLFSWTVDVYTYLNRKNKNKTKQQYTKRKK